MQIVVTNRDGVIVYSQIEETSPSRMNAVVSHLMAESRGTNLTSTVENNGHKLTFTHETLDIPALVAVVNGGRKRKAKE